MSYVRIYLSLFLIFFQFQALADNQIKTADWHEITSEVLKSQKRYAVYLPPSYGQQQSDNEASDSGPKRFPVIYAFDASESRIRMLTGIVEGLSTWASGRRIPESIVVSIAHEDRVQDLTPIKTELAFQGKVLDPLPTSGGGEQFLAFVKTELIPEIERTYNTSTKRTLLGQSFGGLLVMHAIMTQPEAFDNYLAIDPPFVWHDNYLNRILEASTDNLNKKPMKLFIAQANNDHLGELGMTNRMWGRLFLQRLRQLQLSNLSISSKLFTDEVHATVELSAIYHGILALNEKTN